VVKLGVKKVKRTIIWNGFSIIEHIRSMYNEDKTGVRILTVINNHKQYGTVVVSACFQHFTNCNCTHLTSWISCFVFKDDYIRKEPLDIDKASRGYR
jgi:hypothetical protein